MVLPEDLSVDGIQMIVSVLPLFARIVIVICLITGSYVGVL